MVKTKDYLNETFNKANLLSTKAKQDKEGILANNFLFIC